ncbi:MAG: glucosamine-6-phosphate synthase, partial [Actinomycetota bacterium]
MCGIIGVVSRPPTRGVPSAENLLGGLDTALDARPDLVAVAEAIRVVDRALLGVPGVRALIGAPDLVAGLSARLDELEVFAAGREAELDDEPGALTADELERENARLIAVKDALWAIRHDRFRTAREVEALAGRDARPQVLAAYLVAQQAFSALDRLEVRGRDSAGIHLFVWQHDIDTGTLPAMLDERIDPLFESRSVVATDGAAGSVLSFVYKRAAEVGELGDNTAVLRSALASDDVFRRAVESPDARVALVGHTRWASVGIISEPNAHPVNSVEMETPGGAPPPYVVAALNGDVDNHGDLRIEHGLRIAGPITTDAKVIPTIAARHLADGLEPVEAFRRTVGDFEGSVAIAAMSADEPGRLLVALRGSGQGLYVGLADDCYVVASEPYGVVEETDRYVRMDGESGGEIIALSADDGGELAGVFRCSYDGAALPLSVAEVVTAEVTTRDIDRGDAPHFLLKEISESPSSFAKTLRGKVLTGPDGRLRAAVGDRALPGDIAAALADG